MWVWILDRKEIPKCIINVSLIHCFLCIVMEYIPKYIQDNVARIQPSLFSIMCLKFDQDFL